MSQPLIAASRRLADRLRPLSFSKASHTYLPLDYAREPHELYLSRFGMGPKRGRVPRDESWKLRSLFA